MEYVSTTTRRVDDGLAIQMIPEGIVYSFVKAKVAIMTTMANLTARPKPTPV